MVAPGKVGLGFAVGKEPLSALFASYGCRIQATDLPKSGVAEAWSQTDQHAGGVQDLNELGICYPAVFKENVQFLPLDMTRIPSTFVDLDFCWSSCALEHLGNLRRGMDFVLNAMRCLKPGGIAVHTTEFNVLSNDFTPDNCDSVLYRRRDLEELAHSLRSAGHVVCELDFTLGDTEADCYVDIPPYKHNPHIKLWLQGFVTTSYAIIVQKALGSPH